MVLDLLMSDLIGNTARASTNICHACMHRGCPLGEAAHERLPHRMLSPKHTDARTNTQ